MIYYIYKIECTKNNKVYIGQTQNIKTRKNDHFGKLRQNVVSRLCRFGSSNCEKIYK